MAILLTCILTFSFNGSVWHEIIILYVYLSTACFSKFYSILFIFHAVYVLRNFSKQLKSLQLLVNAM